MVQPPLSRLLPLVCASVLAGCRTHEPRPTAQSITVLPVLLAGQPNAEVAAVVGILLERGGMPDVRVGEAAFVPDPQADPAARGAAMAAFVRGQGLATERALVVEIAGTPQRGIERVDAALFDRAGALLWSERHQRGEATFDRDPPKEPMDCCVFVARRVGSSLGLADPLRADAAPGRLAARMQAAAGVPSPSQQAAIDARFEAFRRVAATTPIRVLPPRVGREWSIAGAEALAARLVAAGFAQATAASTATPFSTTPSSNELAVLWSGVASLQAAVRSAPDGDQHILATDFLMADAQTVGAVHCMLLAPNGDVVWTDLQNSHHDDFRQCAPAGVDGCVQLAARRIGAAWR